MSAARASLRANAAALGRLLLPFALILLAYKLHSYWPEAWRGRIHVAEPHAWELSWFGLGEGAARVTPAAWWQHHLHPALDFISGVAYLVFVPAFIAQAAWWRFGPAPEPARTERAALAQRAMWALFVMYVAGYVTYLVYPAAPPWYFERYGDVVVRNAPPDAAGALRFDALVGAPVFGKYYGQSVNVFGAIPSLHCGTAGLALLFALRLRSLRVFSALLFAAVVFGAVYLNHHYLVDGILGVFYAAAAFLAVEYAARRRGA